MEPQSGTNIALVGAGVAGITAAHIPQRRHAVALFEKNDHIGGSGRPTPG
jgi:predicted NAD/FAD-binding protein